MKPEFLLLDIVLIVKTFGGEVGGFGGEASPPHPPVDETLHACMRSIDHGLLNNVIIEYFIEITPDFRCHFILYTVNFRATATDSL